MLYTDFMQKAVDLTVVEADNGLFYLEPMWRSILNDNNMNIAEITDAKLKWCDVFDVLKLVVEKENTINSKKPVVIDWIYNIITTQVEPAILEEQNDYVKTLTEYLKTKRETEIVKDKEEWDKFTKT